MACSWDHEELLREKGFTPVAGVDEAGRGPLAGPVVAAAVILSAAFDCRALDDSKKLTEARRETLFRALEADRNIHIGIGICTPLEIDQYNILRATHLAMRRAVLALTLAPAHLLVDGLPVPGLPTPHRAIVSGDALSFSIAAASIAAKVTRDRIMVDLDQQFPCYGFARHKGYATREHLAALHEEGPCPEHRRSFAPVSQLQLAL